MVVLIDSSVPRRVARFQPVWRKCISTTRRPVSTIILIGLQETNTIGYYRAALTQLGEAYYKQWSLVDINVEQTWETKTRSKSKGRVAQFNDSPELRQAMEEALIRRGVRAVVIDEAQHLMQVASGAKLLDQLDWIKSMTNMTGVVHVLVGTYDLLNFRNLS